MRSRGGSNRASNSTSPNARSGTPAGSRQSNTPRLPSSQHQSGTAVGNQAGSALAIQPSSWNRIASRPPASHSRPSPSQGTGSNRVPSSASGTTSRLTQGTASRLASGPLRLSGNPSAKNSGNSPSARVHCARHHTRHQDQAPSRPPNTQASTATAPNDSQNPACRLASGSTSSTSTNASSNGHHRPR